MRPKFRTPDQVAEHEKKESFSVNIAKAYLERLRKEAKAKKIPVGALINEAIRGYCEFLDVDKKDQTI